MREPSLEHPDIAVLKDVVIRGLSHPQLLEPGEVKTLCEKLLEDLFEPDEQRSIVQVLDAAALW